MLLTDTLPLVALDPVIAEQIAAAAQEARTAPPVTAKRDALIREAYAGGEAGLRELARAAGITHRAVRKIVDRA